MNRRLFWKIFLPFWAAQALLLGALYLRLHYRISSEHPWWIQPERREMPVLAGLAAQTYEQQGQAALATLLDNLSLPNRSRFWLVDAGGHELSGREIPQRVLDDANKAEQSEGLHRSYEANVLAAATTSRGRYVLIAELVPPPLRERVPGDIIWTLKLGTIFSAIICLVIAHYLTKPIERLRNATRQLARGNLDIHAGENMGSRRDEIADLVRDFDTMAGELRKQIKSERSLLSGVSHELRSPIARIRLATTLARESADTAERQEMLDRIEQDTIQLDAMLERILTVSRLESGQLKPKFESLVLNDLVEDVVSDARFETAATHATITCQSVVENIQLTGDPRLLRSAIENVVRNAIFYSGEGGKVDVMITATGNRRVASVIVSDNGPGVPQDKMQLIFEPFYRVDDSRGAATGGMGLGLAIANNAMRAHGGGIIARNVEPHGLEIQLVIPAYPQPGEPGEAYGPFVFDTVHSQE